MKRKIFVTVALVLIAVLVGYKLWDSGSDSLSVQELEPMQVNGATDAFTQRIAGSMDAYFAMKDAFIQADTAAINTHAVVLAASLDSLNTGTLNADTTLLQLAGTLSAAVAGSTRDILAQADIDGKRKAFQAVSDGLFDLLRVVQYKGGPVYQQFCPMAFDNAGAAWLSNSKEVINPYFGDKMLHCGELKDSLRF